MPNMNTFKEIENKYGEMRHGLGTVALILDNFFRHARKRITVALVLSEFNSGKCPLNKESDR